MNAVEIEEAISALAELPFEAAEFPFAFLQAFGNKATTIKRLRIGASNRSGLPGGVLQTNNIHIAAADPGTVTATLGRLKASPATAKRRPSSSSRRTAIRLKPRTLGPSFHGRSSWKAGSSDE